MKPKGIHMLHQIKPDFFLKNQFVQKHLMIKISQTTNYILINKTHKMLLRTVTNLEWNLFLHHIILPRNKVTMF